MSSEGGLHEPKDPETEDFVSSSSFGLFQMRLFAPKMTCGFVFGSVAWKEGEEGNRKGERKKERKERTEQKS